MRKTVTVELDWDTIDHITICSIKTLVECLKADLRKRKDGTGVAIFEKDKKKDIALIKKHLEAFKLVLKYYGENADDNN